MADQEQPIYPGVAYDFLYGGGADVAWNGSGPIPGVVSDPKGAPNDATIASVQASTASARKAYAEWKAASIPSGVAVASIKIYARVAATGNGGTYNVDVTGFVRPDGSTTGATGAYFGTPVTFTSVSGGSGPVYHDLLIAEFLTDPATGVAFTLSTLASMAFGIRIEMPATGGVVNAAVHLSQYYLLSGVASIAADIDGVRSIGSSFLRLFRRPVRMVDITGPLALADVDLLETFMLEHVLGPTPSGEGWGAAPWQRRPLIPISKSYNPGQGTVTLKCIDPRDFYTNWWSTFLTDIGHSLDGQGIPLLHSGGGGMAVTRATVAYIERPGRPPDGLIMDVAVDLPAYDWRGLLVEGGGATNELLNSTFSAGAGNVFTNWTPSVSFTGVVEQSLTTFQFDVTGLRRSCRLFCGGTDSSVAKNASDAIAVAASFRVRGRAYNNFGAGKLGMVIERLSDNKQYDGAAWVAPTAILRLPNVAGWIEFLSGLVDPGGADNIVVHIGYFGEAGTINYEAFASSVELISGSPTHIGSDLPTVASPVTRAESYNTIRNVEVGRVWSPVRGSFSFRFTPKWNEADLADGGGEGGQEKVLLHMHHSETVSETVLFKKNRGYVFRRDADEAVFAVSGDTIPAPGVEVKISGRWVAEDGELGLPAFTFQIFVNDVKGSDQVLSASPSIDPTATIYVGSNGDDSWADGEINHLDFCPLVLEDEELQRRP